MRTLGTVLLRVWPIALLGVTSSACALFDFSEPDSPFGPRGGSSGASDRPNNGVVASSGDSASTAGSAASGGAGNGGSVGGGYTADNAGSGARSGETGNPGDSGSNGEPANGGSSGHGAVAGNSSSLENGGAANETGGRAGGAGEGGADGISCPLGCDDKIPCTTDRCTALGCEHTPDDSSCHHSTRLCTTTVCDLKLGCIDQPVPSSANLLANPDFDSGTSWQQASLKGVQQIVDATTAGVTAQSGAGLARVAHVNDEIGYLYQSVALPALPPGATVLVLTLDGYNLIRTDQLYDDANAGDHAWIDFYREPPVTDDDPYLEPYQGVFSHTWWNEDVKTNSSWTHFRQTGDATAYAGTTVTFAILGANDSATPSDFFFDSLSLTAQACSLPD